MTGEVPPAMKATTALSVEGRLRRRYAELREARGVVSGNKFSKV
jgi:hypothetical protein